ncbi:hypothetical protein NDU88_007122 [Pleurodeles waltl]|uniref:Uncharacterized protein n=1 Tax=Pleurodeles waltl TaxID=8319 RepID=A0AAV7MHS7_PLEWA|nr:hypothetical protein NDU88_007122 [Pleurodeles waltl]
MVGSSYPTTRRVAMGSLPGPLSLPSGAALALLRPTLEARTLSCLKSVAHKSLFMHGSHTVSGCNLPSSGLRQAPHARDQPHPRFLTAGYRSGGARSSGVRA